MPGPQGPSPLNCGGPGPNCGPAMGPWPDMGPQLELGGRKLFGPQLFIGPGPDPETGAGSPVQPGPGVLAPELGLLTKAGPLGGPHGTRGGGGAAPGGPDWPGPGRAAPW